MDDADGHPSDVLVSAAALGEFMRTCLGPSGQRKLFVFDDGFVATNDVHRIFDEAELPDPAARFVAQHVVAQKEEVGDGSLTALVLAGALAAEATDLLEDGLLRATVADGFERAGEAAVAALEDRRQRVAPADRDAVRRAVARTTLNDDDQTLVEAVVRTAAAIDTERRERNRSLDLSDVRIRAEARDDASPVELVRGVVLEYEPAHSEMADRLSDPRVAVVGGGKKAGSGVEEPGLFRAGGNTGEGRTEVSFSADTPDDLTAFREAELDRVREQVRRLEEAGVDAVFCSMGISDAGKRLLREAEITAFRALTETDVALIARATGATVVMDLVDLAPAAVGRAGELVVDTTASTPTVTLSGCDGGAVTLVVAASLDEYASERERDLRAAIATVLDLLDDESVVSAGGGVETDLAAAVRSTARTGTDRTALAMEAYASALECVPRTLAENAGVDPLTVLPRLRTGDGLAFDARGGSVGDAYPDGPLTTPRVARATVETATHVVGRLLRIDDVLQGTRDDDWISADEIDPSPVPERDFDY